jgi:hypothetical protein
VEGFAVRYEGLTALVKALRELDRLALKELRREFKLIGERVEASARRRFSRYNVKSALGFKTSVKSTGLVVVQQSLRKTTGLRPDWGALMMRKALLPGRAQHMDETIRDAEQAVGRALKATGF